MTTNEACHSEADSGTLRGMKITHRAALVALIAGLFVFGSIVLHNDTARSAAFHCGTWTRSGTVRNDTGQEVYLHDVDGRIARQIVIPGASVPFTETLPASTARHADVMVVESLDYTGGTHPAAGWSFDEQEWLYRPGDCTP